MLDFLFSKLLLGMQKCFQRFLKLNKLCFHLLSLLELCSIPSRDSLQKLIVASLDYSHTGIPRIILSKILTASSSVCRQISFIYAFCIAMQQSERVEIFFVADNCLFVCLFVFFCSQMHYCLQATRLYSTSHMRVLLRARVAFFHSWGIELLVTQVQQKYF